MASEPQQLDVLRTRSVPNGGIGSTLTVLAGICAVVAGVYAMVEPMGQRIDFVQKDLTEIRLALAKDDEREMDDVHSFSAVLERFKEVETQFRWLKEVTDVRLAHLEERMSQMSSWKDAHGNDSQWERIRALERAVYGKPLPRNGGTIEGSGG